MSDKTGVKVLIDDVLRRSELSTFVSQQVMDFVKKEYYAQTGEHKEDDYYVLEVITLLADRVGRLSVPGYRGQFK